MDLVDQVDLVDLMDQVYLEDQVNQADRKVLVVLMDREDLVDLEVQGDLGDQLYQVNLEVSNFCQFVMKTYCYRSEISCMMQYYEHCTSWIVIRK